MVADYQDSLRPEVWRMLSLDDRVHVLQALENDYAQRCGRDPYVVMPVEMELGGRGHIRPADKVIEINRGNIQKDELMALAVSSTLHEGRHAYQAAAVVDQVRHPDPRQVQLWRENCSVYVTYSKQTSFAYRFQALERDANDFSESEMARIFGELEKAHGPIDAYQKYVQYSAFCNQLETAKATKHLGPDYQAKIDRAVHRFFEKEISLNQGKNFKIRVNFDDKQDLLREGGGLMEHDMSFSDEREIQQERGQSQEIQMETANENRLPGYQGILGPGADEDIQHNCKGTIDAVKYCNNDITEMLRGNDLMEGKGGEYYFIVVEEGSYEHTMAIEVPKGLSDDECKALLTKEAQDFAYYHVDGDMGLLDKVSVSIEKARGVGDPEQRELYRRIGSEGQECGWVKSLVQDMDLGLSM